MGCDGKAGCPVIGGAGSFERLILVRFLLERLPAVWGGPLLPVAKAPLTIL